MQRGESTDWWTASFWWFLKLTSLNGRTIIFASGISLLILGYSLLYLCNSLLSHKKLNRKALLVFFCSPLYGGFGLNISHDVFMAAGIILFTAFHIRRLNVDIKVASGDTFALILASLLLLTTHYGPFIIALNVILLFLMKYSRIALIVIASSTSVFLLSHIGVTQVPKYGLVLPVLADIKCVAQHPEAEITEKEWVELKKIAPVSEWQNPTSCSLVDDAFNAMPSLDLKSVELSGVLIKTYLGISGRNSAVVAMAHFQRASIALPPPFFAGPQNQVTLDPNIPIGLGTNTALQSHAGVLHPSIDEPSVAQKVSFLKFLEIPAQGLIFIINQASWFWGWGGLWLWPLVVYFIIYLKRVTQKSIFPAISSTLALHGLLLILSAPLPRYVMSTIILGNYFFLILIFRLYGKVMWESNKD